ncbi:MAG TPA: MBL fold metallo-hydrolase, partial [Puia sp.]|nr:MBL fold metallo-hydrolase [Puia sp.]
HVIHAGNFKLDGGAMFGVVPKQIWNKINPADADNLCSWAMRCLLVEEGDRLILIDNGMGDKQDEKFFGHYRLHGSETLDGSLSQAGFTRAAITDVFLTHLHFDHCGGSIIRQGDRLVPAFPNARYWSNEKHWQWAVHPNDREKASFLKENILPIEASGRLNLIDPAGSSVSKLPATNFMEGFDIRFVEGHTASMMLPQLSYKGRTVVFVADLLPSTGHVPIPYVMAYDMVPLTTLLEKKQFLEEAVEKDYVLFFEHDPVNECCTLQRTEKGIRVKEVFRLKEL